MNIFFLNLFSLYSIIFVPVFFIFLIRFSGYIVGYYPAIFIFYRHFKIFIRIKALSVIAYSAVTTPSYKEKW